MKLDLDLMETEKSFFKESSEDRQSIRYSLGEFYSLNHGRVKQPQSLSTLLETYNMPACSLKESYLNKFNSAFRNACEEQNPVRSSRIKRAEANAKHGDERILSDIKTAFLTVTAEKDGAVLAAAKINQMIMPQSKIPEIAQLFYSTILRSSGMTMPYLKVLFGIKRLDKMEDNIRKEFYLLIRNKFQNPEILESTEVTDSETRTNKHRESTCAIYASMFAYDFNDANLNLKGPRKLFNNQKRLLDELLQPLIDEVKDSNQDKGKRIISMKCLVECLSIIHQSNKFPELLEIIQSDINTIYNDKSFKLGKRLLLKDFILN